METSLTKVLYVLFPRFRQGSCLYRLSSLEEGMTFQCLHGSNNSYLKIHSPVIRCLPEFTQTGYPSFPVLSFLSNQYKFKILLVEDSSGNARIEYSMKLDLPNQLLSIALLQAILEQKRYNLVFGDGVHHFCYMLRNQNILHL